MHEQIKKACIECLADSISKVDCTVLSIYKAASALQYSCNQRSIRTEWQKSSYACLIDKGIAMLCVSLNLL